MENASGSVLNNQYAMSITLSEKANSECIALLSGLLRARVKHLI
ncbi:hypothetical protein PRUB_a4760 [Pseudoalteromonas rubra]|uniref:Uncharacterized protein n=1 Tax=Pseudoalteromonas rubra TaxID=43658 RepID=A0A8T0CC42_9GAMM|nr:hypothetical protein PRUB_a4760 [Pseudoalteromonas rubra]